MLFPTFYIKFVIWCFFISIYVDNSLFLFAIFALKKQFYFQQLTELFCVCCNINVVMNSSRSLFL